MSETQSKRPYECPEHGPFGPARFCCACTRVPLEAENKRLREALAEAERHRIRPAVNTVRLPPVDHEPEGSGPFGW